MQSELQSRLNRCVEFAESSPSRKLIRRPFHMAWSRMLDAMSRKITGPLPIHVRTFWGQRMKLVLPDALSVALHRYRFFESGLTTMFLQRLKPAMTVIDIGAHFGYFSLLAVHLVGPTGQVHAFEPTPRTFDILRANTEGYSSVHLNRAAVFSRRERFSFTDYGIQYAVYNTMGAGKLPAEENERLRPEHFDVQALPLDEYVAEHNCRPDLIKIDAEGAEIPIIEGMKKTIAEIRPMITVEVGDVNAADESPSRRLLELVMSLGYRPWEYDAQSRSIRPHNLQERYGYDNVLMVPA